MPIASRRGVDERASLLPAELLPYFDDAFVRSCDLLEEYVARLVSGIARETGIERAMGPGVTPSDVVARAGLHPEVAPVPVAWILGMLAARGLTPPLPREDPREIEAEQEALDPRCLPSYRIAAIAAARYPEVLSGAVPGERALFGADHMEAWTAYFSNDNPAYAIGNRIAAVASSRALRASPGPVLELGGGLGSAASALLERLHEDGGDFALERYRFSEISIPFLRRGQWALSHRFPQAPLEYARLDVDRPFEGQGIAPGSYALIHAVNVIHVARDLPFTLAEIRRSLRPGGTLVAGECVRPFPGRPVYVELVFNLLEAFRRPGAGFHTPEEWTDALEAAEMRDVRIEPDVRVLRDAYPSFVIAAVAARRP